MFELAEMAVPGDHSSEDEGNPLVLRTTVNNGSSSLPDDENGVPDYTGRNPIRWGRISSFEEVSYLLLYGKLPTILIVCKDNLESFSGIFCGHSEY